MCPYYICFIDFYNRILFDYKKKGTPDIYNHIDQPTEHYAVTLASQQGKFYQELV